MEMYVPCTIDYHKDQTTGQRYGLEHINKLLEEELAQLRALKCQKPKENSTVKPQGRNSKVEGLLDYQKRILHVKSKNGRMRNEEVTRVSAVLGNKVCNIAPFAEGSVFEKRISKTANYLDSFPDELSNDKRVIAKGEVPFFQVSSDGSSLSWRLPRLPGTRNGRVESTIQAVTEEMIWESQKCLSKRLEGTKKLPGKLIKARPKVQPDFTSDSNHQDELTDSLVVQYCGMNAREAADGEDKTRKTITRKETVSSKPFHLACTREQIDYHAAVKDEDECIFCACPVLLHERHPQNGGKSRCMREHSRAKKVLNTDKISLPLIDKLASAGKPHAHQCEKCRKRLEMADLNRITLSTANANNKSCITRKKVEPRTDSMTRQNNNRPVTKDDRESIPKEEVRLPMLEYTAYMDKEGSFYILPGAFTLQKRDYNVWSRKRIQSESRPSRTVMCGTSLPSLVRDQKAE